MLGYFLSELIDRLRSEIVFFWGWLMFDLLFFGVLVPILFFWIWLMFDDFLLQSWLMFGCFPKELVGGEIFFFAVGWGSLLELADVCWILLELADHQAF